MIGSLVEGNSIRSTCRLTDTAKGTVTRLLTSVGDACAQYQSDALTDLECQRIQCDEIWSFCYAKEKNVAMIGAVNLGMVMCGRGQLSMPVDGQRKCPAKWPAKMSLVLLAMITDGSYSTRSRFMGGLRASMYFFAVSRWMPSSRATLESTTPLRFAF